MANKKTSSADLLKTFPESTVDALNLLSKETGMSPFNVLKEIVSRGLAQEGLLRAGGEVVARAGNQQVELKPIDAKSSESLAIGTLIDIAQEPKSRNK